MALILAAATANGIVSAGETYHEKRDTIARLAFEQPDAASWNIPFDKPYAKLTPDQKASIRCRYENLAADDEPPYPLDGYKDIVDAVRVAYDDLREDGHLDAVLKITAQGEMQAISFYKSPSAEMSNEVASALLDVKFKPAVCAGSPCAMEFPLVMNLGDPARNRHR
jgi:hypothetical protein